LVILKWPLDLCLPWGFKYSFLESRSWSKNPRIAAFQAELYLFQSGELGLITEVIASEELEKTAVDFAQKLIVKNSSFFDDRTKMLFLRDSPKRLDQMH